MQETLGAFKRALRSLHVGVSQERSFGAEQPTTSGMQSRFHGTSIYESRFRTVEGFVEMVALAAEWVASAVYTATTMFMVVILVEHLARDFVGRWV